MKVLGLGAHPDDLEVFCGGTLALFAARGDEVVMCHASIGNLGTPGGDPAELGDQRTREARRAAERAGAEHATLGWRDGTIRAEDSEQREALEEFIRQCAPDLVITHPEADYHPDHRGLSRLVLDATHRAANPVRKSSYPPLREHIPIIYTESETGLEFEPTEWVDIGPVLEVKRDMVAAHASQLEPLEIEQHRATELFRGMQCGVARAEAFRPCMRWLRVRTRRLLP
ncbi:MAG: PIG-L family deacetylase [Actinobacteria bacterium]|nr:PIG-L family deacetylase [Actinomycetota bacterium]